MANPLHDRYLEAEILNAKPLKLVQLLYRGAIDAVAAARRHLAEKNIRERSRAITRAMNIINHLTLTLDHAAGGDLSHKLAGLYAYMQTRLIEANSRQTEEPLLEVEKLLITLHDGWRQAALQPVPAGSPQTNAPDAVQAAPDAAEPEFEGISCTY